MNPQDEQNTNQGGLVGNDVGAVPPTPANEPAAPDSAAAASPAAAPVDMTPPPVAAPIDATTPVVDPATNNTFSVEPTGPTISSEEPMPTGNISVNGKSKKGLLAFVVIVLLALVGGGVAFMLWNNSDGKIIADAWHNLFKEKNQVSLSVQAEITPSNGPKTSISIALDGVSKDEDGKFNVEVTADAGGMSLTAKAEAIVKDGDVYLKPELGQLATLVGDSYTEILQEVDGQWVKIPKELVEQASSASSAKADDSSATCVANAAKGLTDSVAKQDELLKVLNDSYKYQRTSTNGDIITYNLALDNAAADTKALVDGLKNTSIYKDLTACPGFESISDTAIQDTDSADLPADFAISFSINSKTRQFYGLNISGTDSGTALNINLTGTSSLQGNVDIQAPTGNVINLTDLAGLLSSYTPSDYNYSNYDDFDYDDYSYDY
jgi:hypothetical protein